MTFISYAQNFEDVMLWRALKDVKNGFYVDVGANDPVEDSVTKVFYDAGWSGINIEPLEKHFDDLVLARPRDINLKCAAGNAAGEIVISDFSVRGWASVDRAVTQNHIENGIIPTVSKVNVRTLNDIILEFNAAQIHFLKIDVEGHEEAVLEGIDLLRYRPWILVVEATKPNSNIMSFSSWEPRVINSLYSFVYSDGLNRFYLSKEQEHLQCFFQSPPNVFDNFIRSSHSDALIKVSELTSRLDALKSEADILKIELNRSTQEKNVLEQSLDRIRSSLAYRLYSLFKFF